MEVNGKNFYIQDLFNYNEEFLQEVILYYDENYVSKEKIKKVIENYKGWEEDSFLKTILKDLLQED